VWAWGGNENGQLGNGTTGTSTTPTQVCAVGELAPCASFLGGVVAIAAGYVHSTALLGDGRVVTWGDNRYGQLGAGTCCDDSPVPVEVCDQGELGPCDEASNNVLLGIERLAAGGDGHTLALRGGLLWGWGANKNGQAGGGFINNEQLSPVQVCAPGAAAPCSNFLTEVLEMDAWSSHSLARTRDGAVWGWGGNDYGQLASTSTGVELCQNPPCQSAPIEICLSSDLPCTTPLTGAEMIVAARRFSLALRGGEVWSWGYNPDGELGQGLVDTPRAPGRVCAPGQTAPCAQGLSRIVGVSAGNWHALALDEDGVLWAWGYNGSGQLGDGTLESRVAPVRVLGY
jgi:alpha-tubulin suppressor-like RCC1 family protein